MPLYVWAQRIACLIFMLCPPLVEAGVAFVPRAKVAEEATQQLRNEAAQSAQRAISAEVKVEVLQKAVQQAEERVATLEMQVRTLLW